MALADKVQVVLPPAELLGEVCVAGVLPFPPLTEGTVTATVLVTVVLTGLLVVTPLLAVLLTILVTFVVTLLLLTLVGGVDTSEGFLTGSRSVLFTVVWLILLLWVIVVGEIILLFTL